jgi:hypothetical protein
MAVAGIFIGVTAPPADEIVRTMRSLFGNKEMSAVLKDALESAIWPAYRRLREVTPVGPTGNLRAAVSYKSKAYPRNGGAVALIGYRRAEREASTSAQGGRVRVGPDRAYHQWWLENGTRDRTVSLFANKPYQRRSPSTPFTRVRMGQQETVRGTGTLHWVRGQNAYIASSFNALGPFRMVRGSGSRIQTDPAYPKAFFKKSRTPIVLPGVAAGGVAGLPPIQTAWNQTKSQVAQYLQSELRISLGTALETLAQRTGTISGF